MTSLRQTLLLFGLFALISAASWSVASAQDDGDGNGDAVENDGGREGTTENDGNDGDDTSVGANPPGALIGCLSPYTYLNSQEGLALAKTLIDATGLDEVLRNRNTSATIFVPSNLALRNFQAATGLNASNPATFNRALLRSVLQYHIVFDTVDPTTLAALQTPTSYDTTLSTSADGSNALLAAPAAQLLTRQPGLTYQNLTITAQPLAAGQSATDAPNGTYTITAGGNSAGIIWDATNEPVRTCVGYIYKVDALLLPASSIEALSANAPALAPISGEEGGDGNDGVASTPGDDSDTAASEDGGDGD